MEHLSWLLVLYVRRAHDKHGFHKPRPQSAQLSMHMGQPALSEQLQPRLRRFFRTLVEIYELGAACFSYEKYIGI